MPEDDTTEQETAEDILKRQKEEQLKEDEEDEEEFHLHMGKIMDINAFTQISSMSWDKSYDSPTATSKVEIHYPHENLKDMVKFIYKGVSCKAKLRRSTDKNFETTHIEEYGLDEDGMKSREHYPTKEQREEVNAEMNLDELLSGDEKTTAEEAEETLPMTRSDSDAGVYGFVTDVNHKQTGTELEVKDWGVALEDKTKKLQFNNMMRSRILEEVIKSYGLIPVVDFTGLRDDSITWSNVTGSNSSNNNSNSTSLTQSSEWNDGTSSHDLSGYDTRTVYYAGDIPPDDPKYYETIHDPNANYTKFVQGCTTPEEVMKKLRPLAKYSAYADNIVGDTAKDSFNKISSPGLNCGDSARLVKCCMDSCGIPCIVIHVAHVETAPNGHYYNAVKKDGKWYTTDLCRVNNTIKNRTMTQTLGV